MSRRTRSIPFIVSLTLTLFPGSVRGEMSDRVIDTIDRGVEYLLDAVLKKQVEGAYGIGQVALETYALVVAGVSVNHPIVRKNFDSMRREILSPRFRRRNKHFTYTLSCYVFALDAAINQIHMDRMFFSGRLIEDGSRIASGLRRQLAVAVAWLVKYRQAGRGRWHYVPGGSGFDNSNTQFAVLALGIGARREVGVPRTVWEEIARHFIEGQEKSGPEVNDRVELLPPEERGEYRKHDVKLADVDGGRSAGGGKKSAEEKSAKTVVLEKATPEFGDEDLVVRARGWSYVDDPKSHGGYRWNMTCAGLSSIILASRNLEGVPLDFRNRINVAIRDGYGWLLKNWKVDAGKDPWKYYGIYSLEKVADLGEVKLFGSHDWYEEVSSWVVSKQKGDGSWPGDNPQQTRMNTAFALLVLNRATSLLTRRPEDRIVLTGSSSSGRSGRKDIDDWVYIRSLDRELHIPSVLRLLRLRPIPKLLTFIEMVVDNYPREKIGLLVPGLVKAHRHSGSKRVRKFIHENLEKITGVALDDMAAYISWYGSWKEAHDSGKRASRESVPRLLDIHAASERSPILRKKAIWALMRCRSVAAAPRFLDDLSHGDEGVRKAAYDALKSLPLGSAPPPFDPAARPGQRERRIEAIRVWYRRAASDR